MTSDYTNSAKSFQEILRNTITIQPNNLRTLYRNNETKVYWVLFDYIQIMV